MYSHLDYTTKLESANAITQALTPKKDKKIIENEQLAKRREELENEILRLQQLLSEQEEKKQEEEEM